VLYQKTCETEPLLEHWQSVLAKGFEAGEDLREWWRFGAGEDLMGWREFVSEWWDFVSEWRWG